MYCKINKIAKVYIIGDTSFALLEARHTRIYVIKPNWIPVLIEYPRGIITIIKKDGIAITKSLKLILDAPSIIDAPTIINIGEMAAIGTHFINGANTKVSSRNIATNTYVKPVFPPASIPLLLSI